MKIPKLNIKKKLLGAFEDSGIAGMVNAQAATDWYPRWMEITAAEGKPCISPADIDYNIPQISLEYKLCNPMNLRKVLSGHAADFVAELTDAEREVWYQVDDEGHSYAEDLPKRSVARDAAGVLNPWRKRNINKKK